jgi:hypothetical protein
MKTGSISAANKSLTAATWLPITRRPKSRVVKQATSAARLGIFSPLFHFFSFVGSFRQDSVSTSQKLFRLFLYGSGTGALVNKTLRHGAGEQTASQF